MRASTRGILLLTAALLWSCGGEETDPPPPPGGGGGGGGGGTATCTDCSLTLASDARYLGPESHSALEEVLDGGDTIVFAEGDATIDALVGGEVLIAPVTAQTPTGLMRRITYLDRYPGGVEIDTEPAGLTDAFSAADIDAVISPDTENMELIDPLPGIALAPDPSTRDVGFEGRTVTFDAVVLYDADGSDATEDDRVVLDGSVGIELDFNLDFNIGDGEVGNWNFSVDSTLMSDLQVTSGVDYSFSESIEAFSVSFTPLVVPVGVVELVFVPTLAFRVGTDGQLSVGSDFQAVQAVTFNAGVEREGLGDWRPYYNYEPRFDLVNPTVSGEEFVEVSAGPRFELYLYDVVGPYVSSRAFLRLETELRDQEAWWQLYAGLREGIGFHVLWWEFERPDLLEYDVLLAERAASDPVWQTRSVAVVSGVEDYDIYTDAPIYWGTTAVALDANGGAHVSFRERGESAVTRIRYGRRTATGTWELETVHEAYKPAVFENYDKTLNTSVCVDPSGVPHVLFLAQPERDSDNVLYHAERVDARWQVEPVLTFDVERGGATELEIACAGDGTLHAAYVRDFRDSGGQSVEYASRASSGSAWVLTEVEPRRNLITGLTFANDSAGAQLLYTYYYLIIDPYEAGYVTMHATNATGSWETVELDRREAMSSEPGPFPGPMYLPRAALDDDGTMHVVYRAEGAQLCYATIEGGAVQFQNMVQDVSDSDASIHAYSIAMDGAVPHVSYMLAEEDELGAIQNVTARYATLPDTVGWRREDIEGQLWGRDTYIRPYATDLKIGAGGDPFIVYYKENLPHHTVRFAARP